MDGTMESPWRSMMATLAEALRATGWTLKLGVEVAADMLGRLRQDLGRGGHGRISYHVTFRKDEGWCVIKEGRDRPESLHTTKAAALTHARALAHGQEPSQIIVHKKDSTIQTEFTYGNDPFPPRG